MKVTVKYFARLREIAGRGEEVVEVGGGGVTLDALLQQLSEKNSEIGEFLKDRPVLRAVNGEYADVEKTLTEGDEVALFPPVSGG